MAQGELVELRPAPDRPAAAAELESAREAQGLALSLDQAIALTLEHNLSIGIERYRHGRVLANVMRDRGIYDVQATTDVSARSNSRPPRSFLEEATIIQEDTDQANLSFSQLTPFGGTAQFVFNNSRFQSTNQANDPNPAFTIDLDLSFTQPLARNFGRTVTEQNLIVTRKNSAISREDFQIQVEQIVQQVVNAYWDVVEARRQLEVAKESLALAEDLDRRNRIQVKVGTLAPLEVIQSEAGVAARKEDIIRFQTQVDDAADRLRGLIHLEATDVWDVPILPVTDPAVVEHEAVDVARALRTAYEHRPDVRRRRLRNEILDVQARVARNQKLPRVDLAATYGFNGIDGDKAVRDADGTPIVDGEGRVIRIPAGYSEAFAQVTNREFKDVTVSLQVAFPLQNRTARARSVEAELAVDQGGLELRQLELQVRTDVRRAARGLEAAFQRVETAKVSSHLARKNLEAEQKRYENGLSTSLGVLQIQEDLSEAKTREVSALLAYRRAEAAYYLALGTILGRYRVALADDPSRLEDR